MSARTAGRVTPRAFRKGRPLGGQPHLPVLPLGAMLLLGSMGALAQDAAGSPNTAGARTLQTVTVKEKAESKDTLRATETGIGKGTQQLRDIPQSVTVVTEKLIDDRNLDTLREALKNTAGITFLAAEGAEEDIRLRGFALQTTGDLFVDGMRDAAFYDRDTFNFDRIEVLRGSAGMLFGRGSTGGAVNQVSKSARLIDTHQVDLTLGSHNHRRVVGDFNIKTGESAALRLNAMATRADNNGAGSSLDKRGIAGNYRFGIGERHEFSVSLFHLDNNNGMNYGMPWIRPTAASPVSQTTLLPLDPSAYYGMASDYNKGQATHGTLAHTLRLADGSQLKTQVRAGSYRRDQRAGTVRLAGAASQPGGVAASLATFGPATVLTRGTQLKIQDYDSIVAQSDYSTRFDALGMRHELLAGMDFAHEKKVVYGARSAAQGGVTLTKPPTTVGTPDDGAWVNESLRVLRPTSQYTSTGWGIYGQNLMQIAPQWKLLVGLRHDWLTGDYDAHAIPNNAPGPVTTTSYRMKVAEWSKRVGLLFQPDDLHSYHVSAATSFNTSGDAYSLGAANASTPPEQNINLEFGGKLDSADRRFSTRFALFHAVKMHERNTDPLLPGITLLSGRRHASGIELDFMGRIDPRVEIYASSMWIPDAAIDNGTAGGELEGSRPSLTPRYSGTFWTTYQLTPQWRVGAGVNWRGSQTPNRNPGWSVPSWMTADLMAEYVHDERWSLKANLTNITNRLYADSLYSGHYVPGPGRLLQVTASARF